MGAKRVVVVGGDRTDEAANGLLSVGAGKEVELAVIPRGTGTDFVRTFRIPTKVDEAIAVARDGAVRAIDAGKVSYRAWDGSGARSSSTSQARDERRGGDAGELDVEGARGQGVIPLGDAGRLCPLAERRGLVDVGDEHREGSMLDVIVANCEWLGAGCT